MTEMATLASPGGPANPMIHACDVGGWLPTCAVPVLPPTSMPGMARRVAVPLWTTPIMAWRMSAADWGETAWRHTRGEYDFTTVPWSSVTLVMRWGTSMVPPLAMAAATIAISSGVLDVSPCPIDARASVALPTFFGKSVGNAEAAGAG